ncbi:MAG: hypothetical protein ACK56F_08860 [bacterium]
MMAMRSPFSLMALKQLLPSMTGTDSGRKASCSSRIGRRESTAARDRVQPPEVRALTRMPRSPRASCSRLPLLPPMISASVWLTGACC